MPASQRKASGFLKSIFSHLVNYYCTYPSINEKNELCAYYRKHNKSFPISFLIVIIGIAATQIMRFLESVFTEYSLSVLVNLLKVFMTVDIALLIPTLYCFTKLKTIKSLSQKRNLSYHKAIRIKLQICALFPTAAFMLMPLMAPYMGQSQGMLGLSWLSCYIIQLHICTWVVDGIIYKVFLMAIFNVGYCWISILNGQYTFQNGSKFTTPIILAVAFFIAFDRNLKENFIMKRRFKQQKNMYETHLEKLQDPVLILNPSQILLNNEASKRKIALTRDKFFEKATFMMSAEGESLKENVLRRLANSQVTSDTVTKEKYYVHELGSDIISCDKIFDVSLIESISFAGEKIVSIAIHDVTEEAIQEHNKVESKYRNMFLFSLSHELRTPLNIFFTFLTVMKSSMLSKDQREAHKNAKAAWRYLRNKINDILDYAQMLTEEFVLHKSKFSLRKFVHRLKKTAIALLGKKQSQISLNFTVDEILSDEFEGDKDRIEQVLFNFLSNAEKYTTSGTIELKVYPAINNKQMVTFEVSDTGCGMTESLVASLFTIKASCQSSGALKFGSESTNESSKKSNGLCGLGLTISRMICNRMGSEIKVSSVPLKGSTFSFNLLGSLSGPLLSECAIPEEEIRTNRCREMEFATRKGRLPKNIILVVDDSEMNRFAVKMMIKKHGFGVLEAENGMDALDKLDEIYSKKPTGEILVFMDLDMPVMDGIEATIEIRNKSFCPPPHIVALTAFASESERRKCIEAGMNGFISKPLTKESLDELLMKVGLI